MRGTYMCCHGRCHAEIKCPFTTRSVALFRGNVTCLLMDGDDIALKTSHQYYSQIQGQRYCCGTQNCFLFVYSSHGEMLVPVQKDDVAISRLVQNLEEICIDYVTPEVLTKPVRKLVTTIECCTTIGYISGQCITNP